MDTPTPTGVLLLTGDDPVALRQARRSWVDAQAVAVERIDLAESGIQRVIDAVRSPDMFAEHRALDVSSGEALDTAATRRLAEAMGGSDARVLIHGGATRPHRAVLEALSGVGTHQHLAAPSRREVPGRIAQMARQAGVELDAAGRRALAERSGHDLERVAAVLDMLARAGIPRPQARQIDLLLGSSAAPGVPWEVTDAVEAGDVARALEAVAGADAQAVLSWLGRRVVELGRLAEQDVGDEQHAQQILGGPAWRAGKAIVPARRLGARAPQALAEVVAATAAARGSNGHAEQRAAALVVRLARLFEDPGQG